MNNGQLQIGVLKGSEEFPDRYSAQGFFYVERLDEAELGTAIRPLHWIPTDDALPRLFFQDNSLCSTSYDNTKPFQSGTVINL